MDGAESGPGPANSWWSSALRGATGRYLRVAAPRGGRFYAADARSGALAARGQRGQSRRRAAAETWGRRHRLIPSTDYLLRINCQVPETTQRRCRIWSFNACKRSQRLQCHNWHPPPPLLGCTSAVRAAADATAPRRASASRPALAWGRGLCRRCRPLTGLDERRGIAMCETPSTASLRLHCDAVGCYLGAVAAALARPAPLAAPFAGCPPSWLVRTELCLMRGRVDASTGPVDAHPLGPPMADWDSLASKCAGS